MKNLILFVVLVLSTLVACAQSVKSEVLKSYTYTGESLGQAYLESKKFVGVSHRLERELEEKFASARPDPGDLEFTPSKLSVESRLDTSPVSNFSVSLSEFKKLKNGFELPGIGTAYINSGVRWRVGDSKYLTRAITSYHGGGILEQSYDFQNGPDLARYSRETLIEFTVVKPAKVIGSIIEFVSR